MKIRLKSVVYTLLIVIAGILFGSFEYWAVKNDYRHLALSPIYLLIVAGVYACVEEWVKEKEAKKKSAELKYVTKPWIESEIKFHKEEIKDKKRQPDEYAEELVERFKSVDYTMTFINQRISYIKMFRGADWYFQKYPYDDLLDSLIFWQNMKEYMYTKYFAPEVKTAKTLKEVNKILKKS